MKQQAANVRDATNENLGYFDAVMGAASATKHATTIKGPIQWPRAKLSKAKLVSNVRTKVTILPAIHMPEA